jgi:NADH-quinone oxidoreductase subunit M
MVTGVIALAVPGSSAFAGEFLVLNGIFREGWGWMVVGATGIVLAAMYMLRLISAVLHERAGARVTERALDLRPAELTILVPLVGLLIFLSAWPAAITDRVGGRSPSLEQITITSIGIERPLTPEQQAALHRCLQLPATDPAYADCLVELSESLES